MYADFAGPGGHTDYIMLIFAIYWSVFFDTYVGTIVYVAAFVTEEALYVMDYGFETMFSHLTHVTCARCVHPDAPRDHADHHLLHRPRGLQVFLGMLAAAGSSLSVGLYCASCCLLMINNGSLGDLQDTDDGTRFSVSFILQHFVPLLVSRGRRSTRAAARSSS